ncbi:Hypothetical predicted protein [Octopus vulgaris]|uniref:Uncharacterized protein n=1 Tax=Octopus vulgaris TaxID=6645 RepID=A0AA36F8E1_OCTVU|nr:Hypothetical predicted protein [Octopus vulgaris]
MQQSTQYYLLAHLTYKSEPQQTVYNPRITCLFPPLLFSSSSFSSCHHLHKTALILLMLLLMMAVKLLQSILSSEVSLSPTTQQMLESNTSESEGPNNSFESIAIASNPDEGSQQ